MCLGFAFTIAGVFSEFLPQSFMLQYMSSGKRISYLVATVLAPVFYVCSCTMVPIFSGLLYAGARMGPALTFLLVAPANNILADIVTIQVLGWRIAIADMIAAGIAAIAIGYFVLKTPWGREFEGRFTRNPGNPGQAATVELIKQPLDEGLWNALKFGGYLAKQILPAFFVGLVAVSYV